MSRRWVVFFLVVVVLAYATWWLGRWQFHRLADRKDDNAVVERNEAASPAPVGTENATRVWKASGKGTKSCSRRAKMASSILLPKAC